MNNHFLRLLQYTFKKVLAVKTVYLTDDEEILIVKPAKF